MHSQRPRRLQLSGEKRKLPEYLEQHEIENVLRSAPNGRSKLLVHQGDAVELSGGLGAGGGHHHLGVGDGHQDGAAELSGGLGLGRSVGARG